MLFAASILTGCTGEGDDVSGGADNKNQEGLTVALCGTVRGFEPPVEAADGALWIDDRVWPVALGAHFTSPELLVRGEAVCIDATFDEMNRIEHCVVMGSFPTE